MRLVLPTPFGPTSTLQPTANSTTMCGYERKSTSSSRLTYTGELLVDGVPAELVAQRRHRLHRRRVVLPGQEPREQRGRDDVHRYREPDRLFDGPPALARVVGVPAQLGQLRVLLQRPVEQVQQPGPDDGTL